jgi:hypothetical protein
MMVATIVALALALIGGTYLGIGAGDGFPDPTEQWTD